MQEKLSILYAYNIDLVNAKSSHRCSWCIFTRKLKKREWKLLQNKRWIQFSNRDVSLFLSTIIFLYNEEKDYKFDYKSIKTCYYTSYCVSNFADSYILFSSN